jgi:hypothetical protein
METVTVGCTLLNGLTLEVGSPLPVDGEPSSTYRYVDLKGLNDVRKGAKYATTIVPADLWDAWLAKNKTLRYVVEKAVFIV